MKRIAAHMVCFAPQALYPMSYVELSDDYRLQGVYPLLEEIAGTVFITGAVLLIPQKQYPSFNEVTAKAANLINGGQILPLAGLLTGLELVDAPAVGEAYYVLHLDGLNLSSSEFGTNNRGGNRHIQRL